MGRSETESLRSTRVDFWSGKTLLLEITVTEFSREGMFAYTVFKALSVLIGV